MLTHSGGIFDPATRAAAITEALEALGADPEDFETELDATVDLLADLMPAGATTHAEQIDGLTKYVAILVAAGMVTGKNLATASATLEDHETRIAALE